ncbi:XylR family transcriptional regulator [Pelagicoccus sp. SDUM812002]|uniref:AraC family transcriptional regulator n=1 Tax=Pelagicoccus sp. SDUM812002 TaxID=3041266 RepID=UPI00280DC865|nr:XylR family transcriptional regulator [Pelagicoccus sp. SDUM812002]MDQ8185660.1 XylR family transcriptional regulator [Pelagicoccus sp. SDUM812002]
MPDKNIAILVETSLNSGRQIVRGISRFARERNDWTIYYHTGPLGAMAPASLDNWQGDGIIARIANSDIHERVKACGVPVVDVLGNVANTEYPVVKCDEAAISALVGNHFKDHGFRNMAFFGLSDEQWSLTRRLELSAFCRENLQSEISCFEVGHDERSSQVWAAYINRIQTWIKSLPKPVGIMIASDQFGPDVLAACQSSGLSVPDQVSLVGVDNDLPFCEICQPQLSSVEPNHELVGYEAARTLHCILQNESDIPESTQVSPHILHVRQSSDATALEDNALVKALRFIRSNACDPISVDDIARAAGVSRSVLQRRFRSSLNKTVLESILTVRVNRAKEMLSTTSLPLSDLAERCGFRHQEYLGFVFKKRIGCTPGQYRSQHTRPR